ncbi:DUF7313 family protein [Halorhabdus salina]|uniref:DUF7313 family protein n=1 Tax=Halorhabdus salina TaxID=2750670 RepID=UPI0015EEACA4|nr:hypothetical protein [Halorhabdus salina]
MPPVSLFGPLDALVGDHIEYVLLAVVLANFVTRALAHRRHVRQAAEGGADAMMRFLPHTISNILLVLVSFYYLTLHHHAGIVTSVLVLGLFITDFFEFEARKVEARRDIPIERPKGAIAASLLTLTYAAYQSIFFVIEPAWQALV